MVEFSQVFLDSLAPRDQVFEINEHSDFAIRVFPNGSKTWVFIHKVDRCVQRRTLGIYPEMGIEQAHEALRQARQSIGAKKARKDATRNVTRTRGPKKRPVKKNPSELADRLPVAMIVTGALGIGVFLTLQIGKEVHLASEDERNTSGFVKAKPPVAVAYSLDKVAVTEATPSIDLPEAAATEQVAAPEIPAAAFKPQSASTNAGTLVPPATAPEAATVKRAQFTNGIENREPIDRISRTLPGWDYKQGSRPLFFFTEVAGLSGRTIYHRWELNGRVVSEIPFDVKSSLRWRIFSSKNIMPTMAGRWRVSVVDDLDNVLYSQAITLPTTHLMSAAKAPKEPARPRRDR